VKKEQTPFYLQLEKSTAHRNQREANCNLALKNKAILKELLIISFTVSDKNHFKACWALELVLEKNINLITPHLDVFCNTLAQYKHSSALRSIAKICQFIVESKTIVLTEQQENLILESCLDWLIREEKVATKAYAMRALYQLGHKYHWVHEELKIILPQDFSKHSPAYKACAKDILKRLQ